MIRLLLMLIGMSWIASYYSCSAWTRRIRTVHVIGGCAAVLTLTGCAGSSVPIPTPTADAEVQLLVETPVPAPRTVQMAITMLRSPGAEERIVAARTVPTLGSHADQAIPALIENLAYPDNDDVRRFAAKALGYFGQSAEPAIPALIRIFHTADTAVLERQAVIHTLQQIGNLTVIPELAANLYDNDEITTIVAAEAIGVLAKQPFPDIGKRGYRSGSDGVPLIVSAARLWWETEGKQRDWGNSSR